jgi:CubicO group peptidase (beta-lactamase class C family)
MNMDVQGVCDDRFEKVRRAFVSAFEDKPRMGASLCIFHDGEPVVNLWGGTSNYQGTRPWNQDTISVIFSCTKGLMSILVGTLVESGRLRYDDLVSEIWPEFSENGKHSVTVADLLSHRAGLAALSSPLGKDELLDWDKVVLKLAAQKPLWEPGSGHAYHAITHGWLAGELIRRVAGVSPGAYLRALVGESASSEVWIGLPENELHRVAEMWVGPSLEELISEQDSQRKVGQIDWLDWAMTLGGALPRALVGPGEGFNDIQVLQAEIPGAGGVANVVDLAAIWSSLVVETRGLRLLSDKTLALALVPQSSGRQVWDAPEPWATWGMGFQLSSPARTYLTEKSFGHDGAGGQVTFADAEHKIGFAFLTNQMEGIGDSRATEIIRSLQEVLI